MSLHECKTQEDLLAGAHDAYLEDLHRKMEDPEFQKSFSQWLDENNDSLPEPESFSGWLALNNDTIDS